MKEPYKVVPIYRSVEVTLSDRAWKALEWMYERRESRGYPAKMSLNDFANALIERWDFEAGKPRDPA